MSKEHKIAIKTFRSKRRLKVPKLDIVSYKVQHFPIVQGKFKSYFTSRDQIDKRLRDLRKEFGERERHYESIDTQIQLTNAILQEQHIASEASVMAMVNLNTSLRNGFTELSALQKKALIEQTKHFTALLNQNATLHNEHMKVLRETNAELMRVINEGNQAIIDSLKANITSLTETFKTGMDKLHTDMVESVAKMREINTTIGDEAEKTRVTIVGVSKTIDEFREALIAQLATFSTQFAEAIAAARAAGAASKPFAENITRPAKNPYYRY